MLSRYVGYHDPPEKPPLREHFKKWSFLPTACVIAVFLAVISFPHEANATGFGAQESAAQQTDQHDGSPEIAVPLPKGKKLILTDGSFHMVREYHREGDRASHYCLQRSAWEEIPATLVYRPGTETANDEQKARQERLPKQLAETEKPTRQY